MNTNLITQPLVDIIEEFSLENPEIKNLYSRVRSVLKKYCIFKGLKLSQLMLFDLFNYDNSLNQLVSQFIMRLNKPETRTAIRHVRYKEEVRSNLSSMFRKIINNGFSDKCEHQHQSFIEANIPDFMKPVVSLLPRQGYRRGNNKKELDILRKKEQREQYPLSENVCYLLSLLLKVTEKYHLKSINELFFDHRLDVYQAIRTDTSPDKWASIKASFYFVSKGLGIKVPRKKVSANFNDLPHTLKNQWKVFESRAIEGWKADPGMIVLAAQNGIKIKPLEKSTIMLYRDSLLRALPHISYKVDLDIRDLLRLETVELLLDGVLTTKLCNTLIDHYRRMEWEKQTKHKRKGFDSVQFVYFINAIKTIAAYNGIFYLIDPFKTTYITKIDRETRQKIKLKKKHTFSLGRIDEIIVQFEHDFIKIIKENKFKTVLGRWKPSESHQALRFCFFYVSLVTLRFTGFRQQCIRDCVYGEDIVFNSNGSITFRWEADKIKNDKLFEITLDPKKHERSHGILIRALQVYHDKVYKYLLQRDHHTINKQFFLKLNKNNRAQNFNIDDARSFYNAFLSWSRIFIIDQELCNKFGLFLHPHVYRGLAADWYFALLKGNIAQTANLLGDSPYTIAREYLRNDQHIATSDLDDINHILKQKEKPANLENVIEQKVQMDIQLYRANERAEIAENLVGELLIQLNTSNQQVISLQQQSAMNHSELLGKLEALSAPNPK